MDAKYNGEYVADLINTYFSDPAFHVHLSAGDVLLRQGEPNDRLFVLLYGGLRAEQQSDSGHTTELFRAGSHHFVGVYSFFSETYASVTTLIATEDSHLAYLSRDRFYALRERGDPLFERFMPVVVTELVSRYHQVQELTITREKTFKKLLETEKIASLGQMAAGVAHELNNAIAVLERNSQWLSGALDDVFESRELQKLYQTGLQKGYVLTSSEKRQWRKHLQKQFNMQADVAEMMVDLGFTQNGDIPDDLNLDMGHAAWKMGSALHDVLVASKQATHVVRSMKVLGAPSSQNIFDVNVNETIEDALTLSHASFEGVDVVLNLDQLPLLRSNAGDLVQIWLNLIKNACESMVGQAEQRLMITSQCVGGMIEVVVTDSGGGIPPDILPRIFQPNVTTKVDGLSFGLGLGLTIVQRLIHALAGEVVVESCVGKTTFTIKLPTEAK